MQVQAISNQNFNGSIFLSRNIKPKTAELLIDSACKAGIAKKPYHLEFLNIKDGNLKFLSIKAFNSKQPENQYRVLVQDYLQRKDVLQSAIKDATTGYENMVNSQNLNKVI